jgi:hypothetical protein
MRFILSKIDMKVCANKVEVLFQCICVSNKLSSDNRLTKTDFCKKQELNFQAYGAGSVCKVSQICRKAIMSVQHASYPMFRSPG